jgi:mono/diheme cytochrome c family protein
MMSAAYKKLLFIVFALGASVVLLITLALYDVIKIEWISFMEVQASYKPMEAPLAVATSSIPIEGAAYIGGVGDIPNPIPADNISIERGRLLYSVTCIQCHGPDHDGKGNVGVALVNPPADLTSSKVQGKSDGSIFLTITNGVIGKTTVNGVSVDQIRMPALNENLTVRDRWDMVNFIRSLQAAADSATPTPQP